ncbi:MAG: sigma-70 family RNA polymerase sigma factor [Raineya sp.]|nr:sigma-70 family RNA polymerase sigma factor [Raineya sp.]MDW8297368.1 sigma-70 family RNA polymerase sigma factor [Raineya sp.]
MEKQKTFWLESELIEQLKAKNEKALEYLYDHYASCMYGVAMRILGDEALAQDTLQEAFVKIWQNVEQYDFTKGKLFTWVLNILRNTAIDKLRAKEQKYRTEDLSNLKRKADNDTLKQAETIGITDLTRKLKPEHRVIIEMMYFEGYSQSEIAEKLGIPLGTVKTRAKNALDFLRNLLKEDTF